MALVDLDGDGLFEMRTADDRFAYRFASFAGSGMPISIWRYRDRRLHDVTMRFPELIREDARFWWSQYVSARDARTSLDILGLLAAWAADEYRLGRREQALRMIDRERRSGHLRGHRFQLGGRRYIAALDRFLRRTGYGA